MKQIGEILSTSVGIPLRDPLRKNGSYPSQKEIDDPEKRIENVKDNITCVHSFEDDPTIIVIDDVATSTGTLKYSAKALRASGVSRVVGLAISRSEKIEDLEQAKIYQEVKDEN
jgi:predicted amidophosphoribosyltransferase